MTAYCKKCKQDVQPGDFCPQCGGKLTKASLRIAWCIRHQPVRDWMCWNSVLRLFLPVWGLIMLIILLPFLFSGSPATANDPLQHNLLLQLLLLPVYLLVVLGILFFLQGTQLIDCVIDTRGVHLQWYLLNPTPFKLLLHGLSASMLEKQDESNHVLLYRSRDMAWKDLARVQLWHDKLMILLYAPAWWVRMSIPCTGDTWYPVLDYMREKIGRKKSVILPGQLVAPPKPRPTADSKDDCDPFPIIMLNDDPIDDTDPE